METRIKYIKKNNGWYYAIQVKKWIFWKTIETYATLKGAEGFLNTLKEIDDCNGKIKSLNKIVYNGWAVRNVYKNTGMVYSIIFLLFAFAQWDINPNNWGVNARAMCAFIMSVVLLISFMYSVWKDNK